VIAILSFIFAVLVTGSLVYCILTIVAARDYTGTRPRVRPKGPDRCEPISILKPLYGSDEGLEENLRSFFRQDYGVFEVLMAVRGEDDPEALTARRVMRDFPHVDARLVITGDSPRPNGKVFSLQQMMLYARYDVLVMADSDIRVTPDMASAIAGEMRDPSISLVTCPYRAVPGNTLWSRMEAVGMNTEFLGGVLVARLLDGMNFALGCTLAVRRQALEAAGGLTALQGYLAEDFMMGKLVAKKTGGVILSSYVIQHWIGGQTFRTNFSHRLRWARSTRRSRPLGYVGQVFTNPLPLALLMVGLEPKWWPLATIAMVFRMAAAWAVAGRILHDPLTSRAWYLVPLQDMASFVTWVWGFFGNTIEWRGQRHTVLPNGMFKAEVGDDIQMGRVAAASQGGGSGRRAGEARAAASRG
jgi:ceramide glucosyltransferase